MANDKFKNLKSFQSKDAQAVSILGDMITDGALGDTFDEETYTLNKVSISDIILENNVEIESDFRQDILDFLVNPILLSYDYTEEIKAGFPYRKKTGKYKIIDGQKRVQIYKEAAEDTKYKKISALIVPIDASDETINKIKQMAKENKTTGSTALIEDIRVSENKEISYGHLYERTRIPADLLVERDNKYAIVDDEVEALAESIYKYGLFNDIMALPKYNEDNKLIYEIQAGHKRNRAIQLLLSKARAGQLVNGKDFLDNYSKIPTKLLPLGATKEQIDAVYNESNILSRHLNTDAIFAHLDYFKCVPERPKTKKEFEEFRLTQIISTIASDVQSEFKKIGLMDWKSRKTTGYLNIYFFGSDKVRELCVTATQDKNAKAVISVKDLEWIATTYKDFDERKTQDKIIEEALKDKSYLLKLRKKTHLKKTKTLKVSTKELVHKMLMTQTNLEKYTNADIEMLKDSKEDIQQIIKSLKETKKIIGTFEKRLEELKEE